MWTWMKSTLSYSLNKLTIRSVLNRMLMGYLGLVRAGLQISHQAKQVLQAPINQSRLEPLLFG